jgi:hypothetical protein
MQHKSRLLSLPFLSLYFAAVGAFALSLGRQRWGSAGWFPLAIGLVAAMAIAPLRHLLRELLLARPGRDWGRAAFFLFCACLPAIGVPFFWAEDKLLSGGLVAVSAFFLWGALGTALQWPGFRPPPGPNECLKCRYDLTGNESGVCPECGTPITQPDAQRR